ncbi:MAG: pentapeptide repeat-containing protein [Gemmatimonadota bacterium]|nr:pentapeptide repeat-containing protein [Gemmatimonadota bacterium]
MRGLPSSVPSARLVGAVLVGAVLVGAVLVGAVLVGAVLVGAGFVGALRTCRSNHRIHRGVEHVRRPIQEPHRLRNHRRRHPPRPQLVLHRLREPREDVGLRRLPLGVFRLQELDVIEDLIAALVGERLDSPQDAFTQVFVHRRSSCTAITNLAT